MDRLVNGDVVVIKTKAGIQKIRKPLTARDLTHMIGVAFNQWHILTQQRVQRPSLSGGFDREWVAEHLKQATVRIKAEHLVSLEPEQLIEAELVGSGSTENDKP
jgi:hypothetical protein